jgi:hypothetical protein
MEGYLGETIITDLTGTPYEGYTAQDFAMLHIEMYSGIDGAHHKDWLIDQVARILKGTEVIVKLAKWSNGTEEYRFTLGEESEAYKSWVIQMLGEYDEEYEEYEYSYDTGIAP